VVLERSDAIRRLVRDESGHSERVAKVIVSTSTRSSARPKSSKGCVDDSVACRIVDVPLAIAGSVEHLRAELPTAMAELHSAEDALRSAAAADATAALAVGEVDSERTPHDLAPRSPPISSSHSNSTPR
jgi:hypothetical protein